MNPLRPRCTSLCSLCATAHFVAPAAVLLLGLAQAPPAGAQAGAGAAQAASQPAASSGAAAASPPATVAATEAGTPVDPFSRLRVRQPLDKLSPLSSMRIRDQREESKKTIQVHVRSSPSGAVVTHLGRELGKTPLVLPTDRNNTPMDIVLRMPRYMILRTRVMRRASRTYLFKLHPAKVGH